MLSRRCCRMWSFATSVTVGACSCSPALCCRLPRELQGPGWEIFVLPAAAGETPSCPQLLVGFGEVEGLLRAPSSWWWCVGWVQQCWVDPEQGWGQQLECPHGLWSERVRGQEEAREVEQG